MGGLLDHMNNTDREKIIRLIRSDTLTADEFIWLIDMRTLDEDRGTVAWSKIPPQHFDKLFRTEYFKNAFINCREYFETKFNLLKLQLKNKIIYTDPESDITYDGTT